jgi:hypothetical protein
MVFASTASGGCRSEIEHSPRKPTVNLPLLSDVSLPEKTPTELYVGLEQLLQSGRERENRSSAPQCHGFLIRAVSPA